MGKLRTAIVDLQKLIVNNPVKGFSVSADGRTFTTSIAQLPGDLWVLHGLEWHATPWWRR